MTIISRGSIYLWKMYDFEDGGESKDKYWLALSCVVNSNPTYAVLPTSQYEKHYIYRADMLHDTVIVEVGECQYFSKRTVIDLKNIRKENSEKLKSAIEGSKFVYIGQIEQEIMDRINDAIENAYTLPQQLIDDLLCDD